MAKREAVSTIRGYFYKFDYTILKVLELEHDDDTICIEGIEDVDISNEDNITFHQCKCYEETEYNHSVIAPAVRWMLKHFSENKTNNYNYYIYGTFKKGQDKLKDITVEFAKEKFFTFKKDNQKHILHSELGLTDEDISAFLSKLKINIYADSYETQEKKIKESLCVFLGCGKQEVDLYYCNALSIVKQLSTEKDIQNREISRKDFYDKLKSIDQQFDIWLLHKNGKSKFAKVINKKYFRNGLNLSPYSRFFLIECNSNTSIVDLKTVILHISQKYSNLRPRATPKFCPFFCFHGITETKLVDLKRKLSNDGILFTDGYDFRGAEFNVHSIVKEPTNGNLISLRIIDSITQLDKVFESIHSTIEIYQFYCSTVYYQNNDYKHISIPFETTNDIIEMI